MQLTTSNLRYFFTGLEQRFWMAYKTAPTWYQDVTTTYPVGTEQWVSGWLGMLAKVREWTGPRIVREPAPQTYLVPIQNFELTWGIDKFKMQDDQHGIYTAEFAFHGMQNAKWPDYQVRDLIFNQGSQTGSRQTGTDGVTNWNTAHPVNPYDAGFGTYCNDYRGGVTIGGQTVGGALSVPGFNTVWADMAIRKSDNGEALGLVPDLIVVSPLLKMAAATILNSQFIAAPQYGSVGSGAVGTANGPFVGAAENPIKGWTDTLVVPDFSSTSAIQQMWLMLQTKNMPVRPFSWLLRQAPIVTPRVDPSDPVVFDSHQYLYGSEMRGAPAWSLPFLGSISGPTAV